MNKKTIIAIGVCCILVYGCQSTEKSHIQSSPEWVALSEKGQEEIIKEYSTALDEFAQVMPKFGCDTEAYWAADTVHTMALSLKDNITSYGHGMAVISQMQNYTGYGMAYFNAIIGVRKVPEWTHYVLQNISKCDSLYDELKEAQFEDVRRLSIFNLQSIMNMHLFNTLNRVNNDLQIDEEIACTMHAIVAMDSISSLKEYSDKELFEVSYVLESYSFFKMISPLLKMFSETKEKYDSNIKIILDAAAYFDSKSTPLLQALNDGGKVEMMSDSEFETWMLKGTQYKVKLLRLLARLVEEWEPSEEN